MKHLLIYENFSKSLYYHGSPFLFTKFDLNTEQKGEGWNAYGKGVYLTTSKETAYEYADNSKYHYFLMDGEKATNIFISTNYLVRSFKNKMQLINDVEDILKRYKEDVSKYPDSSFSKSLIPYIALGEDFLLKIKNAKKIEAIQHGYIYTVKFNKELNLFSSDNKDLDIIKFFSKLYKYNAKTNNDVIDDMSSSSENTKILIEYLIKKGYDGIKVQDRIITVFNPDNLEIVKTEKVI